MKKNPLHQIAKNDFTLFIYGASGSLAKLKLFPAIYELAAEKRLPKDYQIVGYARTPMEQKAFKDFFEKSVRDEADSVDEKVMTKLLKHIHYFSGQYDSEEDYKKFLKYMRSLETNKNRVRIAYFSVPPSAFTSIFKILGKVNFNTKKSSLRLVIEKPFGYNLSSAKKLKRVLKKYFDEDQVYLLDHYLGKEAVSNLLSLRYANSILTTLMSKEFVSNIQITALEDRDIEGRANYFDNVGILRDMVQSHLLQILSYLTMFAPREETSEAIHEEKSTVLKSIQIKAKSVVRGQYQGYRKSNGIDPESTTETYAALKLQLKHPLWKGVPMYIRSGKALKQKWTGIVVEFLPQWAQKGKNIEPNRLVIQLQPFEKIEFHLLTKLGGETFDFHELSTGRPIYCSGDCLSEHGRLFLDIVDGDKDLFLNFEEIFSAWKVIDPLQKVCDRMHRKACEPIIYKRNSLGPKEADELIQKDGFEWFNAFNK
jgi:glucose-6-phosphate 1-dehydrogenase